MISRTPSTLRLRNPLRKSLVCNIHHMWISQIVLFWTLRTGCTPSNFPRSVGETKKRTSGNSTKTTAPSMTKTCRQAFQPGRPDPTVLSPPGPIASQPRTSCSSNSNAANVFKSNCSLSRAQNCRTTSSLDLLRGQACLLQSFFPSSNASWNLLQTWRYASLWKRARPTTSNSTSWLFSRPLLSMKFGPLPRPQDVCMSLPRHIPAWL